MTFYFYDLETSGFNARRDRIMQFGGQRTDANLNPTGQPDNILIKITPDVLPSPDAILVTGITPQKTLSDGISEADFCKYFINEIATDDTVFVGYNNLRFDNDFIRFILWRNFYDAYEWCWKNGNSTWDLLDVVRMTRALRPKGIQWPFSSNGNPSNKLELVASINKLEHANAHDALSDVNAVIELAQLIKSRQPKLFDYLLTIRNKDKIAPLVGSRKPMIYTSGRYPSEFEHTTIAAMVAQYPDRQAALMYDLRIDPDQFTDLTPADIAKKWQARSEEVDYFPIKIMAYNKCPAVVGDLRVLDHETEKRLSLHREIIDSHYKKLQKLKDFGDKLVAALEIMNTPAQEELVVDEQRVDAALYDGFISDVDKTKMRVVTAADQDELADIELDFSDDRLKLLFPLYKARNFPKSIRPEEQTWWESYKRRRLLDGEQASLAAVYFSRIKELLGESNPDKKGKYLLEELKLYGQSILPIDQ